MPAAHRMHVQENAAVLLARLATEPGLEDELEPYWSSLPAPNTSLFCKTLFTQRHTDMLQSPVMVRHPCTHACAYISQDAVSWCGYR